MVMLVQGVLVHWWQNNHNHHSQGPRRISICLPGQVHLQENNAQVYITYRKLSWTDYYIFLANTLLVWNPDHLCEGPDTFHQVASSTLVVTKSTDSASSNHCTCFKHLHTSHLSELVVLFLYPSDRHLVLFSCTVSTYKYSYGWQAQVCKQSPTT